MYHLYLPHYNILYEDKSSAIIFATVVYSNYMKTDFIVVGRTRNIPKILEVCEVLDSIGKSYYCFATNEESHKNAGFNLHSHPDKLADVYEGYELTSDSIRTIFEDDLNGLKSADKLIMVLPAGKSSHIEAGIAYGLGKTCYAIGSYEKTDSLYLIFDKIFTDTDEMKQYFSEK